MSQGLNTRKLQFVYERGSPIRLSLEKIFKPAAMMAGVLSVLAIFSTVQGSDYETRVIVSGLSRPTGIAAMGSSTLFITQLPTPGVSGPNGGRNTVDMIKLDSGRITNLTTSEPEPTN